MSGFITGDSNLLFVAIRCKDVVAVVAVKDVNAKRRRSSGDGSALKHKITDRGTEQEESTHIFGNLYCSSSPLHNSSYVRTAAVLLQW